MQAALLVALGSALGGVARYWCSNLATALFGAAFPWGTLIINVVGSFVIGLFNVISLPGGRIEEPFGARLFVMVGLCGGFTTFSSFSLQTLSLMQEGRWGWAGANVLLSVLLCLLAVAAGHWAGSAMGGAPA
jgi:fluoride exporter